MADLMQTLWEAQSPTRHDTLVSDCRELIDTSNYQYLRVSDSIAQMDERLEQAASIEHERIFVPVQQLLQYMEVHISKPLQGICSTVQRSESVIKHEEQAIIKRSAFEREMLSCGIIMLRKRMEPLIGAIDTFIGCRVLLKDDRININGWPHPSGHTYGYTLEITDKLAKFLQGFEEWDEVCNDLRLFD